MSTIISTLRIKFFVLLSVCLFAVQTVWGQSGNWTDYKASGYASGTGTANDPYVIQTAAQLAYFAARVTSGQADRTKCFVLDSDINLSEHFWVPIGSIKSDQSGSGYEFSGTFDGRGHTISNMTVIWEASASTDKRCYGLFSSLRGPAKVCNFILDNALLYNKEATATPDATEDRLVAPLAALIYVNVTIQNIIVRNSKVEVRDPFNSKDKYFVIGGCIAKYNNNEDKYTVANIYANTDIDLTKMNVNATDKVFAGICFTEMAGNIKSAPVNVYASGSVKAGANIRNVGSIYAKNRPGSAATLNGTWYEQSSNTYTYTDSNGAEKNLSTQRTGATKDTGYGSSQFKTIANEYVANNSGLSYWNTTEDGRPGFEKIRFNTIHESHTSREVKCYLEIENPQNYTYTWTVGDEQNYTATENENGYSMITRPISNKDVKVKVTIQNNTVVEDKLELSYTLAPIYYSIDLYEDDDTKKYAGGTGTMADPYIIENDLQLARLARDVNNSSTTQNFVGKYFVLSKDIDLSSALWMPIGTWSQAVQRYFFGKFDGKGHIIKNMRIVWEGYSGKWNAWGLFSRVEGKNTTVEEFASVTNLIMEDALVEKKPNYSPVGTGINIGILLGEINKNTEISNIIIRRSKITDNEETYTSSMQEYRIGGIFGNIEAASNVERIFNLSGDTKVNMFKKVNINTDKVKIAGGVGRFEITSNNHVLHIYPTNIYVHGDAVETNEKANNCVGGVTAYVKSESDIPSSTWY